MWLSILIFLLSIVPSTLIIVWMYKRRKDNPLYKKACTRALASGIIDALPILLLSGILYLLTAILKYSFFKDIPVLAYKAVYNFVVLAFVEEIIKYASFRLLLKHKKGPYSWSDLVALMIVIGTAFGLFEDIPYAIGANAATMLVRGFTMGHVGYAFIMGWFYGKSLYTGNKKYHAVAILLPWALHGLYDFSLSPELIQVNELFMLIALALAILDVILLVLMIRFFVRNRKHKIERYRLSLFAVEPDDLPEEAPVHNAGDVQEGAGENGEPQDTVSQPTEETTPSD